MVSLLAFGGVWYMKQRTDRERMEARTNLRRTRRSLKRFEVLTGVPTNDLPAIEAIQWALPGVINEASDFVMETPPSDDLLPPGEGDEEASGDEEVEKPDLEDMEVPAPSEEPVSDVPSGPEPPSMDGGGVSGNVQNCPLCGSEVVIAEGASQSECPLCGEIINL